MSIKSPTIDTADFPDFVGFDADDQYDVGVKASPNPDYWDSFKDVQIESELLAHQAQLASELTPASSYYVKLPSNDGSHVWGVKDSDGIVVAKIDSNGVLTLLGGAVGVPTTYGPEAMGTPATDPAVLDELNEAAALNFADAATRSVIINGYVHDTSVDVELVWCTPAASGNAKWQVEYRTTADGDAMNGAWSTATETDAAGPYAYSQVTTAVTLSSLAVGETLMLKISRLGDDAADTLNDAAYLMLVRLVPVA